MTVADITKLLSNNADDMYHPSKEDYGDGRCSHCGAPLSPVSVFLYTTPSLWLHAKCAETIALILIKDAFNAASIENGYPIDRGIVPSLRKKFVPYER